MRSKFAKAGAIRQTVSQVFNKDGIQRLGTLWEYWMKEPLLIANYSSEKQNKSLIKLKYRGSYFQIESYFT